MFNGTYGFEEPKNKEEREEFRHKLRQHKNEINNPCIKVGIRVAQLSKKFHSYGNRKFITMSS